METVQSAFGDLTIFDGCRTSCPSTACMMTSGIHEDLFVDDGRMKTEKTKLICWGDKQEKIQRMLQHDHMYSQGIPFANPERPPCTFLNRIKFPT